MSSRNAATQEASKWKERGNEFCESEKYQDAIRNYIKCLEYAPADSHIETDTLANISAAYLNLTWFSLALEYSEKVLDKDSTHLKCILQKGRALRGLNNLDAAVKFLAEQMLNFTSEEEKTQLKDEVNILRKLSVQLDGQYCMASLHSKQCQKKRLDNMLEYKGPVKVVPVEGRGHGMKTTGKISAGDIVLTSRAFVIDFHYADNEGKSDEFVDLVKERLEMDPESEKEFLELFAGNSFPIKAGSNDTIQNLDMIKTRITRNSFHGFSWNQKAAPPRGFWIYPSYINHSCIDANCFYITYGDFLFIRAVKDMEEGEEILICYTPSTEPYSSRTKMLKDFYDFTCDCRRCVAALQYPPAIMKIIEDISEKFVALEKKSNLSDQDAKWLSNSIKILERLKQTGILPLNISNFYSLLFAYYCDMDISTVNLGRILELSEWLLKETDGTVLADSAAICCLNAVVLCFQRGKLPFAKIWAARMIKNTSLSFSTLTFMGNENYSNLTRFGIIG